MQKVIVAITDVATAATVERWQFDIECDKSFTETSAPAQKSEKEIHGEIQGIIRQITASVTFLPVIDSQCELCNREIIKKKEEEEEEDDDDDD